KKGKCFVTRGYGGTTPLGYPIWNDGIPPIAASRVQKAGRGEPIPREPYGALEVALLRLGEEGMSVDRMTSHGNGGAHRPPRPPAPGGPPRWWRACNDPL